MTRSLKYSFSGSEFLGLEPRLSEVREQLTAARQEVLNDVELFNSGGSVPDVKQPLDAGFIEFPQLLLDDLEKNGDSSLVGQIESAAATYREELDRVVFLGIGGSYMGARALFEALCHPYHNELPRDSRKGTPRVYFEGNNVDNDVMSGLLELLNGSCSNPEEVLDRWGAVVISKSGGTLETALSFRVFRQALENYYGAGTEASRRYVVPVTGESGKLRSLSNSTGYPVTFPIPDGIGGRFSILTAVGLLPAAILGIDIRELLRGAAEMTERFKTAADGDNPVMDYTAVAHLLEADHGRSIRIMSTWGARLEALGMWYDQLLSESLGKEGKGATPLTVVNTRDLHSRGQQHQEGAPDKLITNVWIEQPGTAPISMPESDRDDDQLNRLAGTTVPTVLSAAIQGTNQAYADDQRPTADLVLPELSAHTMGQLVQMLMLATVVEGRLIGINPYGQPGVEAYKKNMGAILDRG